MTTNKADLTETTDELLEEIGELADSMPYFSLAAFTFIAIGKQLVESGDYHMHMLGNSILKGACDGMNEEIDSGERYPVCPHCGQRHKPNTMMMALG